MSMRCNSSVDFRLVRRATALICFALGCSSEAATNAPGATPADDTAGVIAAAKRDFASYLRKIPEGRESDYGFADRAEFDLVEIGSPLRVHTIDIDAEGSSPKAVRKIRRLDQWRVPLRVNGERRALLTVVKKNDRFETIDFGAAGLAGALNALADEMDSSGKDAPYLLRIFALRQDFIGIPGANRDERDDRFFPTFSDIGRSAALPGSSIVPTPTVPDTPRTEAELFAFVDEQIRGTAK